MAQTGCKCYCSSPPGSFFNCTPSAGNGCQSCCDSAVANGYWACDDVIGKDGGNSTSISASNNRLPKMKKEKYTNFMGTGISTFKIIWWGIGALVVLAVVGKGVKIYKEAKS